MPELPEVENVRLGLERLGVVGQTFATVDLLRDSLRTPLTPALVARLPGQTIRRVRRRAKYLLFETDADVIISHLGMTGSWRVIDEDRKHDHVRWGFRSGLGLIFNDPRRFGILELTEPAALATNRWLKDLGPEPLGDAFTGEYLFEITRGLTAPLKGVLMDQKRVVGVGNIYASEVLFRTGIRPTRAAGRVNRREALALARVIKDVLIEAIAAGGSTIRDYRNSEGEAGSFQDRFRVYGRDGQACGDCARPVRVKVVAGRSTFWCPKCQPR